MRKFLFLSTIFVATGVWAFGGIGLGPLQRHKSSSGVDAIGVHIDSTGKKANINITDGDSQEPACPTERQCGNTCCGAGNVCVDGNKCCFGSSTDDYNEELCCDASESTGYAWTDWWEYGNSCCPNNRSLTSIENVSVCCAENQYVFISWYDPNGVWDAARIAGACCANDHVVVVSDGSKEGAWYTQECCPAGSTGWAKNPETKESGCCEAGTIPVDGDDGPFCCPDGSTAYDWEEGCI